MISGVEQLDELEQRLRRLEGVPSRAAEIAAPRLLQVARAEYSAGETPEGDRWETLKHKAGAPIRSLTSQVQSEATKRSVIVTTPDELKYHQGGFLVHTGAAGERLREAQAEVKRAKVEADAEGLKSGRKRVRDLKKVIRAQATRVASRATLPRSRRALPVAWADVLRKAFEDAIGEAMKGAG